MHIITTTEQLTRLADSLLGKKFITVDTEFLRSYTYYPKLCLMQIADDKEAYIIDALADDINLEPIFKIFTDEQIVKIFHSGRQDLEIIYNLTGSVAQPIFDTQIAASICGYGQTISYENLCLELLDIKIDKTYQFTDWSKRPLIDAQLNYAIGDVVHLREVYFKLLEKLEASNRLEWIREATLSLSDINNYNTSPDDAWQKISFNNSSNVFVKNIKSLAKLRDLTARKLNIPRGHLMKNNLLIAIANAAPTDIEKLEQINGVSKQFCAELGDEIVASINYAQNLPDEKNVKAVNLQHSATGITVSLLKLLLKVVSKEQNVVDKIIASNDELSVIANYAQDDEVLRSLSCMQDWKYDVFGRHALDLKAGRIAITLDGNDVIVKNIVEKFI